MSGSSIVRYTLIFIGIFALSMLISIVIGVIRGDSVLTHDSLIVSRGSLGSLENLSPSHSELHADSLYKRGDLSGALMTYRSISLPSPRVREKISLLEKLGSSSKETQSGTTTSGKELEEQIRADLQKNENTRSEYLRGGSNWSDQKILFGPGNSEIDW